MDERRDPPNRKKRAAPKIGEAEARKAAQEFEKELKRREAERRREEAAQTNEREKREGGCEGADRAREC